MHSDVKAARATATGSVLAAPARVKGVNFLSDGVGTGRLTITDGNGGATLIDLDFVNSDQQFIEVPSNGVRCETGIWISALTNATAVTIFYEG